MRLLLPADSMGAHPEESYNRSMSLNVPWLNMPEEFYRTLNRFAGEYSVSSQGVLGQVPSVLESAYHVKPGEPIVIEDTPEKPLIPVWFKLPEEFWTRLDRLVAKTGKSREKLIAARPEHHGAAQDVQGL